MKKIISIMLILMFVLNISPIYAENDSKKINDSVYYSVPTKTEFQKRLDLERSLREKYALSDEAEIHISIDAGSPLFSVLSFPGGTEIGHSYVKTPVMIPGNQNPKGIRFNGSSGMIYWTDKGGPEYNIGVSINSQYFSFYVGAGFKNDGVTGYSIMCPPNTWCKLTVIKELKITRYYYKIYDVASGLETEGYVNVQELLGVELGLIKNK